MLPGRASPALHNCCPVLRGADAVGQLHSCCTDIALGIAWSWCSHSTAVSLCDHCTATKWPLHGHQMTAARLLRAKLPLHHIQLQVVISQPLKPAWAASLSPQAPAAVYLHAAILFALPLCPPSHCSSHHWASPGALGLSSTALQCSSSSSSPVWHMQTQQRGCIWAHGAHMVEHLAIPKVLPGDALVSTTALCSRRAGSRPRGCPASCWIRCKTHR